MTTSVLILGRGDSGSAVQWPPPLPVMAVSGGIDRVPDGFAADHFVTVDPPHHFRSMPDATVKHVPLGTADAWAGVRNLRTWPVDGDLPFSLYGRTPIGLDGTCNSFGFALQVAHRLGFRRLVFAGCDVLAPTVAARLEGWYAESLARGVAWEPLSVEVAA